MRSYLDKHVFFNKMKKKPAVQEVIDNIDNYTIDRISSLTGSHFPLWIKEELIKIKENNGKLSNLSKAEDIAERMNKYHERNNK